MPDPYPLEPKKRGCLGWVLLVLLAVIVAAALVFWRGLGSDWWKAFQQARELKAKWEKVLNFTPEIQIDSRVVIAANVPKFEVVTVQKQAVLRHAWSHSWLHSTKTFDIEATFTAQAGYDFGNFLHINIDSRTGHISIQLPPPKILSIGMSDIKILTDEDGLWNRLTPEDRREAFQELEKEARKNFEASDLLEAARTEMEKRVRQATEGVTPSPALEGPKG